MIQNRERQGELENRDQMKYKIEEDVLMEVRCHRKPTKIRK